MTSPERAAVEPRKARKYGLNAKDVVLPHEDAEKFQARLDEWLDYYDTDDPVQIFLIERAVLASWRLDRCTRRETAELNRRARHAAAEMDLAARVETERLGRRLLDDPLDRSLNASARDPRVQK